MRCLLFPPESTSSPEREGGSKQESTPSSLPSVLSPSASSPRLFQGPSIREVQAAVGNLRETSLRVVEAVQAWRRERHKELNRGKRGDVPTKPPPPVVSWGTSSDGKVSPSSVSLVRPEHSSSASKDGVTTAQRTSQESRFPVVPTAQPVPSRDEDLPTFWWFPPATGGRQPASGSTQASHRTSLGQETSVPEQVGRDLNEEPAAPAADAIPGAHRHSDGSAGNSAPSPAGNAKVDPSSDDPSSAPPRPSPRAAPLGANYLAGMATDTDFVGAPGSILVDFFPPDTKLYRNPFVLGHNLDDTLAVFSGNGAASPRDPGARDGVEQSGSAPAALKKGRLDTRRVRLASAAIVVEDTRERSGDNKRHRAEELGDQDAPAGGVAGESCQRGSSSDGHDGQRFDRPDSGGSRSGDGDHGGSDNSPKKRRGKGGIRFQDEQSEG